MGTSSREKLKRLEKQYEKRTFRMVVFVNDQERAVQTYKDIMERIPPKSWHYDISIKEASRWDWFLITIFAKTRPWAESVQRSVCRLLASNGRKVIFKSIDHIFYDIEINSYAHRHFVDIVANDSFNIKMTGAPFFP